jgi:hypothetical protein
MNSAVAMISAARITIRGSNHRLPDFSFPVRFISGLRSVPARVCAIGLSNVAARDRFVNLGPP